MAAGARDHRSVGQIPATEAIAKHTHIRSALLEMIDQARVGDRLPPERELAKRFGVSRMTLRQAVASLANAGYVARIQGAGTFVADPKISKGAELTSFSEDMARRGLRATSTVLATAIAPVGAQIGPRLGLSPAEFVTHIERVRLADHVPMCLETIDIPVTVAPQLSERDLGGSLYGVLKDEYGVSLDYAEQVVTPTVLDESQAKLLEVPPYSAALVVRRVTYDNRAIPVEHAVSVYRGDRYDLRMTIRRSTI